jgi:hypothetical protein
MNICSINAAISETSYILNSSLGFSQGASEVLPTELELQLKKSAEIKI